MHARPLTPARATSNVRPVDSRVSHTTETGRAAGSEIDSPAAWRRLWITVVLATIGGVGMWSFPVALPAVQAAFGVARADASVPFTLCMIGFALGGVVMGRLVDRLGVAVPLAIGAAATGLGYIAAGLAPTLWVVAFAHVLIGIGASATFGPLMADASQWFLRRRGIAVSIAAAGNYLAGVIWPPIVQYFIANVGWRETHVGVGVFCAVTMLPLVLAFRRPPPMQSVVPAAAASARAMIKVPPNVLQVLLCIAGVGCCVAMAMPQVHIVAYCGDLGYGPARGAEMLSLMLAFGIVSRVASGLIADRIGGLATLLAGSVLQGIAIVFYLFFDGLISLYVISALFGLFQGGIIPMYAVIVRDNFSPREVGTRLGLVLMATLGGMALGGWMSGFIFDLSGSYRAAFLNGIAWNLLNVVIMLWLLTRSRLAATKPA
jgi:MFS family permease